MRTTLTLDDDVFEKLRREMRRTGASLKDVVNANLRAALSSPRAEQRAKPFKVEARDLGLRPGVRLDDVAGLLDALDGPAGR